MCHKVSFNIWLLLEGKPFEVWEGHLLRDFNYVDDCVEALLLAAVNEKSMARFSILATTVP